MGTVRGLRGNTSHRLALASVAVALGAVAVVLGIPAAPPPPVQSCPPGQVEDTATPGFQCVTGCPWGMLLDRVSNSCVAAPGVPPPPLP